MRTDLNTNFNLGDVIGLRNNAEADIVVLLTNGPYTPFGIAFVGPAPEAPFVIVQAGAYSNDAMGKCLIPCVS